MCPGSGKDRAERKPSEHQAEQCYRRRGHASKASRDARKRSTMCGAVEAAAIIISRGDAFPAGGQQWRQSASLETAAAATAPLETVVTAIRLPPAVGAADEPGEKASDATAAGDEAAQLRRAALSESKAACALTWRPL